jgi:hypothetical protein
MPTFTTDTLIGQRPKPSSLWLVDGKKDWAFIRGKLAKELEIPDGTPIRLLEGNERNFGARHVYKKQRRKTIQDILRKHQTTAKRYQDICKTDTYAAEYVWLKLNSSGNAYTTEGDNKTKIALSMNPSSLLILTRQDKDELFYSITSLIPRPNNNLDGDSLGRYLSSWANK